MSESSIQYYCSEAAQSDAKKKIAALTDKKDLILVTGAGFSSNFGYPLWKKFLDDLKSNCHVILDENQFITDGGIDYLKYAQEICNKCGKFDFQNFISETFDPINCKNSEDDFYKTLISMGFCGFVTLNYDYTLEKIAQSFKPEIRPEPIDFCIKGRKIRVRKFLDNASTKKDEYRYILHLHGDFTNPDSIILTQDSYERCYLNGSVTELIQLITDFKENFLRNSQNFFRNYWKLRVESRQYITIKRFNLSIKR